MDYALIERYNFWSEKPKDLGLLRSMDLKTLESFDETSGMIVVLGARRVGKSVLMKQFIAKKIDEGCIPKNILYLNFF